MRTVFVIGSGFIGRALSKRITDWYPNYRVVVVDQQLDEPLSDGILFESASLINACDTFSLFKKYSPDYVINISDQKDVGLLSQNITMAQNLIDICSEQGVERLIHISTGRIYGDQQGVVSERSEISPPDTYSVIKFASEKLLSSFENQISYSIIRLSNIYGEGQVHGPMRDMIFSAASDQFFNIPTEISVHDWLHINDCCRAIDRVLHFGERSQIYNVGSGKPFSDKELSRHILGHFELPFSMIEYCDDAYGFSCEKILQIDKIKKIGWIPQIDLLDGIEPLFNFYKRMSENA